jgi:cystathionine beta-lyase/cystathionine gamma-synthase
METRPTPHGPSTRCVHGDRAAPLGPGEPLVAPIVRSAVFRCDDATYAARAAGHARDVLCYSRETNPTLEAVERRLAVLEGAQQAFVFASGMAALHAVMMAVLRRGDRVVLFRQLYGGSHDLARRLLPRLGVELAIVDVNDLAALEKTADERLRLVLCESLSNPLTIVADLPGIRATLDAHAPRALLAVDATLASPVGQRPLEHGADLVLHSATKALGGHSDLIGGVVAGAEDLLEEVWVWRTKAGGCLDPDPAWLLARGLSTLALRVRAASASARRVAAFLAGHPAVERVHYCGLEGDPSHALAQRLLDETGGLLSFVVRGGDAGALRVLRGLRLITEAASLGGVESLASRPRDLSQVGLSEEERRCAGIVPGLLRLALGVEETGDLLADLERALGGS